MSPLVVLAALLAVTAPAQCGTLRLATHDQASVPNESRCEACLKLIAILKGYVADPTSQQRAMNVVLTDICPKLPPDARQYCAIYTPIGIAALAGWIESANASEACGQVSLCPDKALSKSVTTDPVLRPMAAVLQSQAVVKLLSAHAINSDECDTCKMAIVEVAAILADPVTQRQALQYAEGVCDAYPDFHDQCLTYVQMYGPLILNAAVAYMNPGLCNTIGICPA